MLSIQELKGIIAPMASTYGVRKIILFGSYARGKATPRSDLDLLIADRGKLRGLIKLAGFKRELEAATGLEVDLLAIDALDKAFLSRIQQESIVLFEHEEH